MTVYAYNEAKVKEIIDKLDASYEKLVAQEEVITNCINTIKENWRDSDERLGQRNKDLTTLLTNVQNIKENIKTIKTVIENQSAQYARLNY